MKGITVQLTELIVPSANTAATTSFGHTNLVGLTYLMLPSEPSPCPHLESTHANIV